MASRGKENGAVEILARRTAEGGKGVESLPLLNRKEGGMLGEGRGRKMEKGRR